LKRRLTGGVSFFAQFCGRAASQERRQRHQLRNNALNSAHIAGVKVVNSVKRYWFHFDVVDELYARAMGTL